MEWKLLRLLNIITYVSETTLRCSVVVTAILISVVFSFIGCGWVINNTLKSPNYPMDYPGTMDCIYNVTIPQNMALKIFFEDFLLQNPSVYNDEW